MARYLLKQGDEIVAYAGPSKEYACEIANRYAEKTGRSVSVFRGNSSKAFFAALAEQAASKRKPEV